MEMDNPLVYVRNGHAFTSSSRVADFFSVPHKDVYDFINYWVKYHTTSGLKKRFHTITTDAYPVEWEMSFKGFYEVCVEMEFPSLWDTWETEYVRAKDEKSQKKNKLVYIRDSQAFTSSLRIAESLSLSHEDVVREIHCCMNSLGSSGLYFNWFRPLRSDFSQKGWEINKNGFSNLSSRLKIFSLIPIWEKSLYRAMIEFVRENCENTPETQEESRFTYHWSHTYTTTLRIAKAFGFSHEDVRDKVLRLGRNSYLLESIFRMESEKDPQGKTVFSMGITGFQALCEDLFDDEMPPKYQQWIKDLYHVDPNCACKETPHA